MLLVFVLLLVSCQNVVITPEHDNLPGVETETILDDTYPEPNQIVAAGGDYEAIYPSKYLPQKVDSQTNTPMPQASAPGFSTISGRLLLNNQIALSRTLVYITPGRGENQDPPIIFFGPELEKGDYTNLTDDNAFFLMKNISPGIYYLIVSSTNDWAIVEVDGKPLKLIINPDQILNLGDIYIQF